MITILSRLISSDASSFRLLDIPCFGPSLVADGVHGVTAGSGTNGRGVSRGVGYF